MAQIFNPNDTKNDFMQNIRLAGFEISYANDISQMVNSVVRIKSPNIEVACMINNFGLESPYMGSTARGKKCAYCYQSSYRECYGHSGIISNIPMYISPAMVKMFVNFMNITCHNCGKLLLTNDTIHKMSATHYNSIVDLYSMLREKLTPRFSTCPSCKAPVIKFRKHKESLATVALVQPAGESILLSNDLERLKRTLENSEDWNDLFGSYYRMFLNQAMATYLSVIPFPQRLYAFHPINNVKQAPYIQFMYMNLLSAILKYDDLRSSSSEELADENKIIFDSITRIMVGENKPNKIGEQMAMENNSSLLNVGNKKGFLRNNCLTKVLGRFARLTSMCNNDLLPGYVTIPQAAAMHMVMENVVTADNIEIFSKMNRKERRWPAIFEIISNGVIYSPGDLLFSTMELSVGDKIKRSITDNDIVVVSRPPILKNTNQMTCRIIVAKDKDETNTGIGINSTLLANMFSGDNDGDMLKIVPTEKSEAIGDMAALLNIDSNSRTYKNGSFDLALMSNGMIGLLMATIYSYEMPLSSALELYDTCQLAPEEKLHMIMQFKKSSRTMVDFLNTFIPDYVNLRNKTIYAKLDDTEPEFIIDGGVIKSGIFCSNTSGGSNKTSIVEYIYMTHGAKEAIHFMHRLRLASMALMKFSGYGYTPIEGHIDQDTMDMIRTTEQANIRKVSTMIDVLDSTPHSLSATGSDIKQLRIISTLDPYKNTKTIISGMPHGRKNRIFNLVMGSKRKTDDLTQLGGIDGLAISGDRLLPHIKNDRIFCMNSSLSNDPTDWGYMSRGSFIAASATSTQYQSITGSKALCGRQFMTSKPGFISRFSRNALGGIFSDVYGNLVMGTHVNNPHVIYSAAGIVNGKPDCVGSVYLGDWIKYTPKEMEDKFQLANGLGKSELFDIYKSMYEMVVEDLNATMQFINAHVTTEVMEVLYSPHKNMRIIKASKSVNPQCHVSYCNFIKCLPYIMTGYDSYVDGITSTATGVYNVRMLIMMMLIVHPPNKVQYYDVVDFDDYLQNVYKRISDSLLDPGMPVGCRTAMTITEELTQKTLDAPKTAKGYAVELTLIKNYMLIAPNHNKEVAHCFIEDPLLSYDKFPLKTFSELSPNITMMKQLPDKYLDKGYGKVRTDSPSLYNIICKIDRSKETAGLNIVVIIDRLSMDFNGLVFLLEMDMQTATILLQCEISESPSRTEMIDFINKNIMNMPISGIEGIYDIKLETTKRQEIVDGVVMTKDASMLIVTSNSIVNLLKIPAVKYDEIMYENPGTQKKYFGIASAMSSMMHFCATMFPGQYHSNSMIYAAVATCSGEYTPINQYIVNKLWPDHMLQDVVLSKPKEKLFNAPQIMTDIKTDDIVSGLITGMSPAIGSGVYTMVEELQSDDKFEEVPFENEIVF